MGMHIHAVGGINKLIAINYEVKLNTSRLIVKNYTIISLHQSGQYTGDNT